MSAQLRNSHSPSKLLQVCMLLCIRLYMVGLFVFLSDSFCWAFYMCPCQINMAQILALGFNILSGETFSQAENSAGRRWDSNPGPCEQHGYCCKRAKPLRHLNLPPVLFTSTFFFFCCCLFTCTPDSIELDNWGTWHRCQRWGSMVEWRNLFTGEKLHWSQVGLEPRSLQIAWPLLQAR